MTGDGDLLYDILQETLSRARITTEFINVQGTNLQESLLNNTASCTINLSQSRAVLDAITLVKGSGRTINLVTHPSSGDEFGMSVLLKNISVTNFKPGFLNNEMYWGFVKEGIERWNGGKAVPRVIPMEEMITGPELSSVSLLCCSMLPHVEKIVRDYFHLKSTNLITARPEGALVIQVEQGRIVACEGGGRNVYNMGIMSVFNVRRSLDHIVKNRDKVQGEYFL